MEKKVDFCAILLRCLSCKLGSSSSPQVGSLIMTNPGGEYLNWIAGATGAPTAMQMLVGGSNSENLLAVSGVQGQVIGHTLGIPQGQNMGASTLPQGQAMASSPLPSHASVQAIVQAVLQQMGGAPNQASMPLPQPFPLQQQQGRASNITIGRFAKPAVKQITGRVIQMYLGGATKQQCRNALQEGRKVYLNTIVREIYTEMRKFSVVVLEEKVRWYVMDSLTNFGTHLKSKFAMMYAIMHI